jgi:hypothetical protein
VAASKIRQAMSDSGIWLNPRFASVIRAVSCLPGGHGNHTSQQCIHYMQQILLSQLNLKKKTDPRVTQPKGMKLACREAVSS